MRAPWRHLLAASSRASLAMGQRRRSKYRALDWAGVNLVGWHGIAQSQGRRERCVIGLVGAGLETSRG